MDKKYNGGAGVSGGRGDRGESTIESVAKLAAGVRGEGRDSRERFADFGWGCGGGVASLAKAEALGVKPDAKIVAYHTSGVAPKDISRRRSRA